jgi:hypothetical protein
MADPVGTKASVSQRVVSYGTTHIGKKVGRGECWDLPFYALQQSGAKTPHDLGADLYVWGTPIERLEDAQPGDILQFEGVRVKRNWMTADGRPAWEEFNFGTRHSAIVQIVDKGLFFTTLNAHVTLQGHTERKLKVQVLRMNLSPENIVSGTIRLYRPIPK